MKFSDYYENIIIDHMLRGQAFTPPATIYLALYTSDPTDADTGTEVSGGAYARQSFTLNAASGGAADNAADIVFPIATAAWGIITHVGIRDALAAGNLMMHGALTTPKTVGINDQFKILAGNLDIMVD